MEVFAGLTYENMPMNMIAQPERLYGVIPNNGWTVTAEVVVAAGIRRIALIEKPSDWKQVLPRLPKSKIM
jgi:hypothetical protein